MNTTPSTTAPSTTRLVGRLVEDAPAKTNRRIHKPQVSKQPFSRLTAPAFDPALVSTTLNG